jgi:CBS domain-containing protein
MSRTIVPATVRDAMHAGIVTCPPSSTVEEIAAILAERQIHCVLVAGRDGCGWGIVSDLDLMRAVAARRHELTAAQLASMEVVTVGPGEELAEAARRMAEHEVAHLAVSEAPTAQPIGVLSTLDVARAIHAC